MNPDDQIQSQPIVDPTTPPFSPGPPPVEPVPPVSDLPGVNVAPMQPPSTVIPPPTVGPPTVPPVPNTTVLQPSTPSQVTPMQLTPDLTQSQPIPAPPPPQVTPIEPVVVVTPPASPPVMPLSASSPVYPAQPSVPTPQVQSPPLPAQTFQPPSAQQLPRGAKKKNIGIIVGVILAALVILAGIAYAVSLAFGGLSKVNKGTTPASNITTKTAESISDYSAVCDKSKMTNAADFGTKPHKIVSFQSSALSEDKYTESVVSFMDKTWSAETEDLTNVQLVACMKRTSPVVTKKCDLMNSKKEKVSIDFYSVTYLLTVYEAKTGKSRLSATVTGMADKCPYSVLYNPSDPKIYADPDKASLESAIKDLMNS